MRLFQNLQASRQTELADHFHLHVVTDWIGNSPDIAERLKELLPDVGFEARLHAGQAAGRVAGQGSSAER